MKQRVAYFVMIWDAVILVPVQEAKKWMLDELLSFPICRSPDFVTIKTAIL